MKIEVWSDFVCPFCYIGKRRLELALNEFEHKNHVQIMYKSFELDPNAKAKPNQNIHEYLAAKKGITIDHVREMNKKLEKQAEEVGLIYNFDTMQHTNTFDAHRLAKYAETKQLGLELIEKLLQAYFTESELISDYDTLLGIALDIGLDKADVEEILATNRYAKRVIEDEETAKQIGIKGVPFFVFNEKYAVSGAQPKETFVNVLQTVWEEEYENSSNSPTHNKKAKTSYCTGEGCDLVE
jgi:predicted DsbA family dithiol-disulfide isomerase